MTRSASTSAGHGRVAGVGAGVTVVAAATLLVVASPAPVSTAADPTMTPIVVPDGVERSPLMSDDGSVLAFITTLDPPVEPPAEPPDESAAESDPPAEPELVLRLYDPSTATTVDVATDPSFAGLSRDGCVVAWAGPPTDTPDTDVELDVAAEAGEFEVNVFERCAEPPISPVTVGRFDVVAPLTLDGSGATLAINTGTEIVRLAREPGEPFVETDRFDAAVPPSDDTVTAGRVAMSADGSTIVFESRVDHDVVSETDAGVVGAALDDGAEAPAEAADPEVAEAPLDQAVPSAVFVWEGGVVTEIAADAGDPSISADGQLVALVKRATDGEPVAGAYVIDRSAESPASALVFAGGSSPVLSGDGTALVAVVTTESADGAAEPAVAVQRAVWSGSGATPFDQIIVTSLDVDAGGGPGLPVPVSPTAVSAHGELIAADGDSATDIVLWAEPVVLVFEPSELDLGSTDVGQLLTGSATLRNDGSVALDLADAAIAVGSPFEVATSESAPCTGLLRPQATCTVDLSYDVAAAIAVVADLTVTHLDSAAPAATATVTATGTSPTTTTGATTTTSTTTTTTSVTTRPTPRPTTRPTPRPTTRPTVTIPPAEPSVEPASFEFAPTIVQAGRRSAEVSIVNPSNTSITVASATIEGGDGAFAADPTTCTSAPIAAQSRCAVVVQYAPIVAGQSQAALVVTFSDGASLRSTLTGVGAPPPVLTVVPGVANHGQVVTVRGSGFPAGAVVELSVGTESTARVISVSGLGGIDVPIVVMPNTTLGPLLISVAGQVDLFGDVETTLLISSSSDRASPAVIRGVGPNIGR